MTQKISFDLLVQKALINQEQLDKACQEAQICGVSIEKALDKLGFISEIVIAQVFAETMGVPFIDLSDYLIDPEVIQMVPEKIARKYKIIPLFKIEDSLTIAMSEPSNIVAIDEIREKSKVEAIDSVFSTEDMILKAIDQYYTASGDIKELVGNLTSEKAKGEITEKKTVEASEEIPVIKLVNLIITEAIKDRASDIHIEPQENKVLIRYRVDGILHEAQQIPKHLQSVLLSRIKIMANMDIAETRNPQDGRIELKMENKNLDLRVSSFPTVYGENIVLRILDKSAVLFGLEELGFSEDIFRDFQKVIQKPNGIILVTGPTGSGKTTTLYSALSTINSVARNIITIEDPVEYLIPLIRQTQVNQKAGLTFANGLRSILRQDPDVIMVGEIRDIETAEIAIQASLTGHLVFSTLHTNDAVSTLTRLLDMGIEAYLIASSIIGILAERLVRVICPDCKEKYTANSDAIKDLHIPAEQQEFYHGKGCLKCKQTGFIGRIGIFELLLINDEIKEMVIAKKSAGEIKQKVLAQGMRTLFDDGLEKVKKGVTSIEEVLRVTREA
jgi:type IV pilus assembly protein PilB